MIPRRKTHRFGDGEGDVVRGANILDEEVSAMPVDARRGVGFANGMAGEVVRTASLKSR